ncbi:LEA domain protein [Aspergillus terreus]|uniref:LEA domain protein n=1 Tax=Aspergillus terreus TaxID=33178 RepID=A0A5M3YVE5_ASPTE|nr:hypothetical protein ATETN484_0004079200 [Aspergillus terreus]GFF13860.1 LEA domain protein [Aspergillus terreus]
MGSTTDIPLQPLPVPRTETLAPGLSLIPPLSRRGSGPGMIVLVPDGTPHAINIDKGAPSPALKWAEESYTVIEIRESALDEGDPLVRAIEELRKYEKCTPKDAVGLVAYSPKLWAKAASSKAIGQITAASVYATVSDIESIVSTSVPIVQHLAGVAPHRLQRTSELFQYAYEDMKTANFAIPKSTEFHYATEAVSHTRNLTFLKKHMDGPYFDLEAIWDEHTYFEFDNRSVEHTMSTMVQEPYVNHIPTITGGIGRDRLTDFYRHHFIFNNPKDTKMELISRTVGIDRVVDEFIMTFTHDSEVDWILPKVPPTGRKLEIPLTAVVNVRGDRLYHEHISWDQATVLVQLGFLPEYLPYPYPLPDGRTPAPGKRFEVLVPTVGVDTVNKMRDKNSVPSNQLFEGGVREV